MSNYLVLLSIYVLFTNYQSSSFQYIFSLSIFSLYYITYYQSIDVYVMRNYACLMIFKYKRYDQAPYLLSYFK